MPLIFGVAFTTHAPRTPLISTRQTCCASLTHPPLLPPQGRHVAHHTAGRRIHHRCDMSRSTSCTLGFRDAGVRPAVT